MRLKRVRVFGFKTFADRTEFSLEGGIVAVVGPNGCGKSNLVDAILWGLGEGNARQLRAASGADVIFNGSSRRKAVGFAEVSLLFDNEDGALPIESSEVSVSRRLTRTGDSDYAINRRNCRQRDVYELFADSGLGRAGYAIVGQKEIDQALAASPEERRGWIDEAAGVQRYRTRKVEAQRRLAAAETHLERVSDILNELESQREPLRLEAEAARRYKSLLESLRGVETGLLVRDVARALREAAELEAQIRRSIELSREEVERAETLEAQVRATGETISALESEMDSLRGLQQGSLTALERAEANLRLAAQKLESLDELEATLKSEGDSLAERRADAEREVTAGKQDEAAESQALSELRTEAGGADAEAKELTTRLKALDADLMKAKEANARWLKQQAEETHRKERLLQARRERQGVEASLPDLRQALAAAQTELDAAVAVVQTHLDDASKADEESRALRAAEEADAQESRKALSERAALEGRKRGIEATIDAHEGLNQGARAVLEAAERGILDGSYVPVGEAVIADKDLALAIETALGGAANDLIVDHEGDAKAAIAWLKEHRQGRATFQPIPLMRPPSVGPELDRLLRQPGIVGRASELVDCEARFRPVIDSILGRVVVAEDLDAALRHAKTSGWSRMVTRDGEVLHSGGAVTGGHAARQTYGLVQRKADLAEIERRLGQIEKLVRAAEKRSGQFTARREELKAQGDAARAEAKARETEAKEARAFVARLADEIHQVERSIGRLDREIEALSQTSPERAERTDLAPLEQERDDVLRKLAARTADAEQAESRLREQDLRLRQAAQRREAAERRLAAAREAESQRERRLVHLEPERARLREDMERHGREREHAGAQKRDADHKLEVAQDQRRGLLESSLQTQEEAKAARANAAAVGEAAHQAEVARARAESRRAAAAQRLLEEYGLTEEDAVAQEDAYEIPDDAPTVVSRLRRDMKAMGDVNLGAIEAFDRLTARHDELEAQRTDILDGIVQVQASIRELDALTRDRFAETFSAVKEAYGRMFEKLFGGGQGEIRLTDPDRLLESGVEIEVTLPGKRRQPLPLLSGGERALCATAFLFSLLLVKPSPLVVLDEVDAPLDGRNVERFVDLLREFSLRTQFIVITHNPVTIEAAPVWLGVTMQEPGVSTLVPARAPKKEGGTSLAPPEASALAIGDGRGDNGGAAGPV